MPRVESTEGQIEQLDFDSLAEERQDSSAPETLDEALGLRPEATLFAVPRRNKTRKRSLLQTELQQATLDGPFVLPASKHEEQGKSTKKAIQPAQSIFDHAALTQLDFETLATISPQDAVTVTDGEPAGGRVDQDGSADGRSLIQPGDQAEDGLPGSLGDRSRPVPFTGRRVFLEEPEEARATSRDFHITEEHNVGKGGLHEKASANIEAIRLLKTLEAEDREATEAQKAVLVRYAGWGALAQVFEQPWRVRGEWQETATAVRELLTETEYESARATTPNAHFTSPQVISAIWQALERLGVGENSRVLEPAMGVGHFFGLMPDAMAGGERVGVEIDSPSARIAKKLYPDAKIFAQGLEETQLPDNYFDAVVGNVPFGDYGVHDPTIKKNLTHAIHDYFFAKSLEKLRPGGIMALITSRYTMDKQDDTVRRYLAERANLLAAVRLPNTAFKGNAGTEVVTDILFLQKRAPGDAVQGECFTQTGLVSVEDRGVLLNEYYARHPEMMLGQLSLAGTMYAGRELTLSGEISEEILQNAVETLPRDIYQPRTYQRVQPEARVSVDPEQLRGIKDGGFAVLGKKIFIRVGNQLEQANLSETEALRVSGLIAVRNAVQEVFRTQLEDCTEEEITNARQELNRVYDRFVHNFGYISSKENFHAFAGDPDRPLLLSLENYDPEINTATKTTVFERRTVESYHPVKHTETAQEALAVCLNETGGIDWQRMSELTGYTASQLQAELGSQVYQNPEGTWETGDEYLSGNVRHKLQTARAAAALNSRYQRNVEALEAVQPPDIPPGEISVRLGASWIPKSDIADFISETLKLPLGDIAVGHAGEIATWSVGLDNFAARSVANTTTYGTNRSSASALIEDALNMRVPTIYDTLPDDTRVINQTETIAAREAQQKLKDLFAQWVWQDPARTGRLARVYNDTFNALRLRTYDGSHLTFPGMNKTNLRRGDLDPHQKNAVWRVLQNKSTLLGHAVGAGKTFEIAASCMELKRIGLANKPMIVVPNHLVEQWGAAFIALYPQANIFVAGREHFSKDNRERAMARIATGNYDAVIISHKSFESLPVSDETYGRFMRQEMTKLEEAIQETNFEGQKENRNTRSIVKQLEKAKKRLEAKIRERTTREKKDKGVSFEELGIDGLFVDESDAFKNLGFITKMQRIAGLPNSESNRAMDMYMKTRSLSERGGRVVFATGTPISNTMAEMYTLMRYLAPELLKEAGVAHFDAWAGAFGEAVTALELAPDGSGYRMHTRFAKFVNLPELLSLFHTFADIQTADMLNLPRPEIAGGKPRAVVSPASAELKDYVAKLVERARQIKQGGVNPRIDNMLKITTDGRKAALDMRLVSVETEDEHKKLSKAARLIYQIWQGNKERRLTQMVFCDISTPHPHLYNAYDELRERLERAGVPRHEIAFIHDADTDRKKQALFDSVNAGRIRILIGSTEKMGAGTNVQTRLVALHHIDAPWRPRDIEQREGRILRQGNTNPKVGIYRYVTEGSFDAYMWQTLETKARFIAQVMSGRASVREAEDLEGGALTYAEIKAIASGNPLVMDKVRIDTELRRLSMLKSSHVNQQYEIAKAVSELPEQIKQTKQTHQGLLADIAVRQANDTESFTMTVDGQEYSGKGAREKAGEALLHIIKASLWDEGAKQIGTYKGFAIITNRLGEWPRLTLRATHTYETSLNMGSALGTIAGIENAQERLDRYAGEEGAKIVRMEKALIDYRAQLHQPFEQEAHMTDLLKQQQELSRRLDLDKSERQVIDETKQEEDTDIAGELLAS